MSRSFVRTVLHLLLALSLALPAIAAPAQAAADALQALAAASMADTAMVGDDMPCHGDAATDAEPPCDCCPQSACDLSACIGTGCLNALPHVVAHVPPTAAPAPLPPVAVRTRLLETPLRPPIA